MNLVICGYGNVAFELVKLLRDKKELLKEKYHEDIKVTRIILKDGMLCDHEGINLDKLINLGKGSEAVRKYGELVEVDMKGDVLIDLSPTNIENGEPSNSYILKSIENKMDVVTASKGALVLNYAEIARKAKENNVGLAFSGATAAALPTLDLGLNSLKGTTITEIRGILNGTSNYILSRIFEVNISLQDALKEAQEKGIAEKNYSLDIKGFDTACKILLIVNKVLGKEFSLNDIEIEGIDELDLERIEEAKRQNKIIRLIGEYKIINGVESLKVLPRVFEKSDFLGMVNGTNKAIEYITEEMGSIFCAGGASDPQGAAAAVLKDVLNMI